MNLWDNVLIQGWSFYPWWILFERVPADTFKASPICRGFSWIWIFSSYGYAFHFLVKMLRWLSYSLVRSEDKYNSPLWTLFIRLLLQLYSCLTSKESSMCRELVWREPFICEWYWIGSIRQKVMMTWKPPSKQVRVRFFALFLNLSGGQWEKYWLVSWPLSRFENCLQRLYNDNNNRTTF